jgi:hypothetical protein
MEYPPDIAVSPPHVRAHYLKMVEAGQSPRFAEMCALGAPPGTQGTDRAFMEGRYNNQQLDSLPRRQAEWLSKEAREAGINISGKYYCGGIADSRGWRDPEAWVGSADDVSRVAKARNLHVTGAVNNTAVDLPPERKLMSESIIKEEIQKAKRRNPRAKAGEVREKLLANHAYRVKGR